jgi:hypothetical protein
MGATDIETMANVTIAKYDFDDEVFNEISGDAKDFIQKLLVKDKEYVNCFAYTIFIYYIIFYCLKISTSCVNITNYSKKTSLSHIHKNECSQICLFFCTISVSFSFILFNCMNNHLFLLMSLHI